MEKFIKKLNTLKSCIKLHDNSKKEIRDNLARIVYSDVTNDAQIRQINQRSAMYLLFNKKFMSLIAIIAIVVALGGGASFAAEGSLPGDVLYPVKVNFTEEVRGAISLSSEAKALWEARRAERRLEEAEELAVQGRADAEAHVRSRFEAHADRVQSRIDAFADSNAHVASDVASRFEASLLAHEKVLVALEARGGATAEVATPVRAQVGVALREIVKSRVKFEASATTNGSSPDVEVAARGRIKAATNFVASTRNYIETRASRLGAETTAAAEAKLDVAASLVAEAEAQVEAEAYAQAFATASRAIRISQEARSLIEVSVRVDGISIFAAPRGDIVQHSDEEAESNSKSFDGSSGSVESEGSAEGGSGGTSASGEVQIEISF